MHELDPDSRTELDDIGDDGLQRAVERVLHDPAGHGQPGHTYTRCFRNPHRYVKGLSKDLTVWEFKPSRWRGLFVTVKGPSGTPGIFFIPVKGKRFWTMSQCPWH